MYYAKDISISLRNISWNLAMLCEILRPEEPIKRNEIKGFTNENKTECETTMVAPAFDDEPFIF